MDARHILNQLDNESAAHPKAHRHVVAYVASIAAHAIAIAAIVFLLPAVERPHHDWVLAYFVEFDKGGSAPSGEGSLDTREPGALPRPRSASMLKPLARNHHASAPPKLEVTHDAVEKVAAVNPAMPRPATERPPADGHGADFSGTGPDKRVDSTQAIASSVGAAGLHSSGSDGGLDEEGGGAAAGAAQVAYGQNPAPRYPATARRLEQQGTVVLRVLVDADGSVARVEIVHSSGFDSLDDSAIETVRTRWRFIPARRDGVSVASWAEVPIRFALTEASAN